jgi:hypothetical protein
MPFAQRPISGAEAPRKAGPPGKIFPAEATTLPSGGADGGRMTGFVTRRGCAA